MRRAGWLTVEVTLVGNTSHWSSIERFIERVLDEIDRVTLDSTQGCHDRLLEVNNLLRERGREMATGFNDPRRTTAFVRLLAIRFRDPLTEEEFGRFSPETRDLVCSLVGNSHE